MSVFEIQWKRTTVDTGVLRVKATNVEEARKHLEEAYNWMNDKDSRFYEETDYSTEMEWSNDDIWFDADANTIQETHETEHETTDEFKKALSEARDLVEAEQEY